MLGIILKQLREESAIFHKKDTTTHELNII